MEGTLRSHSALPTVPKLLLAVSMLEIPRPWDHFQISAVYKCWDSGNDVTYPV